MNACARFYLSAVLCDKDVRLLLIFFLHSYHSQLKLVRLKVSESGMYTFLATNGDATVHLTFEVYVLSKTFLLVPYLTAIIVKE